MHRQHAVCTAGGTWTLQVLRFTAELGMLLLCSFEWCTCDLSNTVVTREVGEGEGRGIHRQQHQQQRLPPSPC